jgi:hypothetical protein
MSLLSFHTTAVKSTLVLAICLHNQQSNNFRKEQQQNAEWSGLSHYMSSFAAFLVGVPSKGVHYMLSGF